MEWTKEPCPDEETLLAYGLGLAEETAARAVEAHLESCDACLSALALAKQRLRQTEGDFAVTVPPEIVEKVAATPHRAAAASAGGTSPATRRRVRLPIPLGRLLPLALAASVLLVVGSQAGLWRTNSEPERLTRSIALDKSATVSVAVASVRREPHPRADIVATLRRGDVVRIGTEEREWYRVSLPDGTEGWVEQDAFR